MTDAPLPCPFCGRNVEADPVPSRTGRSVAYEISHRCALAGHLVLQDDRRDWLLDRWNTRAPTEESPRGR